MARTTTEAAIVGGPTIDSTRDYWVLHLKSEGRRPPMPSPIMASRPMPAHRMLCLPLVTIRLETITRTPTTILDCRA